MKKLLLVFCSILLMSGSAAAQPVTVPNIGTVDLPPGVIVTSQDDYDGAPHSGYAVRIKDGAVWRSMSIEKEQQSTLLPGQPDKQKTLPMVWEDFSSKVLKSSPTTILAEPAKKLTLEGKDCINASYKWDYPGFVVNMESFMVSESDGVTLFIFMCADNDRLYWRPFMLKIAGATP